VLLSGNVGTRQLRIKDSYLKGIPFMVLSRASVCYHWEILISVHLFILSVSVEHLPFDRDYSKHHGKRS